MIEGSKEVCVATTHCALLEQNEGHCDAATNVGCGGGNKMDRKFNFIRYYSKKYNMTYPIYMEQTVTGKIVFCCKLYPPVLRIRFQCSPEPTLHSHRARLVVEDTSSRLHRESFRVQEWVVSGYVLAVERESGNY